ncbi:Phage protein [Sodalis praecaptivus]|uniref:Phage protein n=1 Tax=Sodalis praecaptivus TaxID=1239307 RepID=W0I0F5_9GAMM|nr:hypothetical protein [Sodalis praecaptivus]AHF77940.1 Phage protein [Sodalis praecaptivus]
MGNLGYFEGDTCARDGCEGVIELEEVENCSCHLYAPCWRHENADMWCPECGWQASKDPLCVREISTISLGGPLPLIETRRRVLDPTKIDWITKMHSSSSMIKEGVYPEYLTRQEVEKEVRGTFGGRFEYFGDGKFKYIAYTD